MNKLKKTFGQEDDTRSLLKNMHKKVYSICRLFTSNYATHQSLFTKIISAAAQNIRLNKSGEEKQTLFLRACINMAALQAISLGLAPDTNPAIQFKSPDYQKSMMSLQEGIGGMQDYEKILLFLNFENWPVERIEELSGLFPVRPQPAEQTGRPHFSPTLKDKLIWI